jgi:DNA invertase Pin-like site-specific DNA recombinase
MSQPHVAIYARYSTDKQDARSIDDQLRRCREYAERHGMEVASEHSDEAQSGASRHRAGLQRLMAEAEARRFSAVLVDDLSRLSRDLGDTWQIVFGDLAAAGVKVIDCTTGMASDGAGARLTFGAMALVNDTFLQLVRSETHRGLEGRALAGFHTGGSCFGYLTVPEERPQDPEHPRKLMKVDLEEAAVVRRIFNLYAEGQGLGVIADALNAERVRAPQDGASKKRAGHGWSKNQIGSMLRNERYIGRVVWNKRKWIKVDGKRRPRDRPQSEWKVREEPALAIIDPGTWARVQARIKANAVGPGRPGRSGYLDHVLSGLLRCGACGSPLSIVSRKQKNGQHYSQYGCSAHHHKGMSVCSNGLTIGEARLTQAVLDALRSYFASPDYEAWLEEAYTANERARARAARHDDEVGRLETAVRAAEGRVEKVTEAIARIGYSEPLAAKLRSEEARLLDVRKALAQAATPARPSPTPPAYSARAVLAVVKEIATAAAKRPQKAKELLQGVVESILMQPSPDGYAVRVVLKKTNPAALVEDSGVGDYQTGCGGVHPGIPSTRQPSFLVGLRCQRHR